MSVRHASRSVVDARPLSRSPVYVCRRCRRNAHPSQVLIQQRQYASERPESLPLAERVRRKLWKGKPPGPENVDDLYGGPGALETMFKERRERRTRPRTQPIDEPTESQASVEVPDTPSIESKPQASVEAAQNDAPNIESKSQSEKEDRELAYPGRVDAIQDRAAAGVQPETAEEEDKKLETKEPKPSNVYKQATSWEGLRIMGHKGHWREMPVRRKDEYTPWLPPQARKEWSYAELVSLMHQAIVETYTIGKSKIHSSELSKLNANTPFEQGVLEKATISLSPDGMIASVAGVDMMQLPETFPSSCYDESQQVDGLDEHLTQYSLQEEAAIIARTEPIMTPLKPRNVPMYTPADTSFLDATLKPLQPTPFQILKRFTKLMNHPIPDPLLSDLASTDPTKNTLRVFLNSMVEKTKKKDAKVAELLMENEILAAQKNVLILGRRETPVDKEKELGRWKVIEEELRGRGLPVLGRAEVQR